MQDYENNIDGCHIPPHEPIQDAMEPSLTRNGIRQGGEAQLQVDSPPGLLETDTAT